jgi:hypothetical protein
MARRVSLKTAPSDPVGARESNAGDEFHVLWVLRRALTMLAPNAQPHPGAAAAPWAVERSGYLGLVMPRREAA